MRQLIFILISLITISCNTPEEKQSFIEDAVDKDMENDPCGKIDLLISKIDSIRFGDYSPEGDSLMFIYNNEVAELGELCAQKTLEGEPYTPENFHICLANDSLFGILSWNTQMGGTMINYEHIKFWKTDSETRFYNSYHDIRKREFSYNDTFYNYISTVARKNGQYIYLCAGSGQGSSCLPWFILEAFEISDNSPAPATVFPESKHTLSVMYDLCSQGDYECIIRYEVEKGQIKAPLLSENNIPYTKTLHWNGHNFVLDETYESFIPAGYTILEMKKGYIYSDREDAYEDVVMILRDTIELTQDMMDLPRPIIVLKGTKDGFELGGRSDHAVMCQDCGGMMGDPFDYLEIAFNKIELAHYGGSASKWYERAVFQLDKKAENWVLNKHISGWYEFDMDENGNEVELGEETTTTVIDFGVVTLENYGKEG